MNIPFSKDYSEVRFNSRSWRFEGNGPTIPTPLYGSTPRVRLLGTMSLWLEDVAVLRTDDGRTFTFGPIGVGCA
jgi:hypothetical protein